MYRDIWSMNVKASSEQLVFNFFFFLRKLTNFQITRLYSVCWLFPAAGISVLDFPPNGSWRGSEGSAGPFLWLLFVPIVSGQSLWDHWPFLLSWNHCFSLVEGQRSSAVVGMFVQSPELQRFLVPVVKTCRFFQTHLIGAPWSSCPWLWAGLRKHYLLLSSTWKRLASRQGRGSEEGNGVTLGAVVQCCSSCSPIVLRAPHPYPPPAGN